MNGVWDRGFTALVLGFLGLMLLLPFGAMLNGMLGLADPDRVGQGASPALIWGLRAGAFVTASMAAFATLTFGTGVWAMIRGRKDGRAPALVLGLAGVVMIALWPVAASAWQLTYFLQA